jgi:hypothetical protein
MVEADRFEKHVGEYHVVSGSGVFSKYLGRPRRRNMPQLQDEMYHGAV